MPKEVTENAAIKGSYHWDRHLARDLSSITSNHIVVGESKKAEIQYLW